VVSDVFPMNDQSYLLFLVTGMQLSIKIMSGMADDGSGSGMEAAVHGNCQSVWKLDLSSQQRLASFPSLTHAARSIVAERGGNVDSAKAMISAVATGGRRSAFGFAWEKGSPKEEAGANECEDEAKKRWTEIRGIPGHLVSVDAEFKSAGPVARSLAKSGVPARVRIDGILHSVARLMAQTFLQNPHGRTRVGHLNGDRADDRLENLVWLSDMPRTSVVD
jgi:hypothetical protein